MDQLGPVEQSLPRAEKPIVGAEAIAEFIFGDKCAKRKVYYLSEKTRLPIFRMGSMLCLRPSAYQRWIEHQEERVNK